MKMQEWYMDLYHLFLRNMKDKRGSGTLIFGLLFLIPFMTFGFWIIESKLLNTQYNMADDAIVTAGLGALKSVDPIELAYKEWHLDSSSAREVFNNLLKKNMKLDNNFNPLPGSVAISPVKVEEFRVYNPGDYPTECPRGTLINNTSIHVVVSFKMKRPVLHGLFGKEVVTRIHRDVDNFYSLELED